MPGLTINSNLPALRETFKKYCERNRRDFDFLVVDQTRKLATELYQQTAAVAPGKSQIAEDVRRQGWHIPTWFHTGFARGWRIGRGTQEMWLSFGVKRLARLKGRKSKKRKAEEAAIMGGKPTLGQMQAFVIRVRQAARLYIASGWLGAVLDLGGTLKSTSGAIDPGRGGATVEKAGGSVVVTFWNKTPGVVEQDEKHHFVKKALTARMVDMWAYIARKMRERGANFGKAA